MFMNKRKEHGITVTTHTMAWIAYFKSTNSTFFHDIRKECSAPKCNINLNKSNLGKISEFPSITSKICMDW